MIHPHNQRKNQFLKGVEEEEEVTVSFMDSL